MLILVKYADCNYIFYKKYCKNLQFFDVQNFLRNGFVSQENFDRTDRRQQVLFTEKKRLFFVTKGTFVPVFFQCRDFFSRKFFTFVFRALFGNTKKGPSF